MAHVEKIILFYKDLFSPSFTQPNFDFDFLLLKPNAFHLLSLLDSLEVDAFSTSFRFVFSHCVEAMEGIVEIKIENALKTMQIVFQGLTRKVFRSNEELKIVFGGSEMFDNLAERLFEAIGKFMQTVHSISALKLLLMMSFQKTIHHNPFMMYFKPVFVKLELDIVDYSLFHRFTCFTLMLQHSHYQQYESFNSSLVTFSTCDSNAIERLDCSLEQMVLFTLENKQSLWSWLGYAAEKEPEYYSVLQKICVASFYFLTYHHRKFLTASAKFKRDGSVVKPTEYPKSLVSFLTLASKIFQTMNGNVIRTCLLVLQIMSQDMAAQLLFHEEFPVTLSIYSKTNNLWRSFSNVPLISIQFLLLSEFVSTQLPKLLALTEFNLNLLKTSIEIIIRNLVYQYELQISSTLTTNLAGSYVLLMRMSSKIIERYASASTLSASHLIFFLAVIRLIKILLTCCKKLFAEKESEFRMASVLYELARMSDYFQKCLIILQLQNVDEFHISEFTAISDLSLFLTRLISDEHAAKKFKPTSMFSIISFTAPAATDPITVEESISIITSSLSKFEVPAVTISNRFTPYVENPNEVSVINGLVTEVVSEYQKLILDFSEAIFEK